MALLTIQRKSAVLNKCVELKVLISDAAKPPYPVLYLLHGLGGDASGWTRFTVLERLAETAPFLIVMPDADRHWYCDSPLGAWETFFTDDLVPYIDNTFQTRAARRYRGVSGLSMGGYGALHLALKHPDIFGSATAHSAAVHFAHYRDATPQDNPEMLLLKETLDLDAHDLYMLAAACSARSRPKILIDCGRDDFLYRVNERFQRYLKKIKFPHTYKRYSGAHDWDYWIARIPDILAFHAKSMRVKIR